MEDESALQSDDALRYRVLALMASCPARRWTLEALLAALEMPNKRDARYALSKVLTRARDAGEICKKGESMLRLKDGVWEQPWALFFLPGSEA